MIELLRSLAARNKDLEAEIEWLKQERDDYKAGADAEAAQVDRLTSALAAANARIKELEGLLLRSRNELMSFGWSKNNFLIAAIDAALAIKGENE